MIIKNGKVFRGVSNTYENVDVRFEDGKIIEVAENLSGDEIIDASGCFVYPGFVEAHCHLGMDESSIQFEGDDVNEMSDPITSHVRGIDGCYPLDETVKEAREGGVTTVATGPGSANVVGGTFFAMKTVGTCVDDMAIMNPIAMKAAFGENPKRCYKDNGIKTRMGVAAKLREVLFKTREYMNDEKHPFDMKLEALVPVLKKELPLKVHAHRSDDILTALRIAKEFDINLTLDHVTDGEIIKDKIAESGFPAIVGPSFGHKSKFELKDKSFKTAKALQEAGILVAITTDSPVIPQMYLPLCAGLAHKDGMDEFEALKAITINPAKILGLDGRLGSLEAGKDADIVISKGSILDSLSEVQVTVIDGEVVYSK